MIDRVASLDEDRILRSFIGVIDATLRTSYYIQYKDGKRKDGGPADYISFKFDSAKVPDLPKPRPYREIFVYGPRVEGVHLRFGPVARGGLRWSDRREDFRTEVLGLVKAQMVKNTVIVPVGSKGGFFCKQSPDPAVNRDAWFAEGVACYKRFINGLLDITDNLVDGKVVHPDDVVRHDARRSVPGRRRRQGHGDVLRHRQRASRARTASGWTTRSPPAVRSATTTRAWASPPRARGNRSSATSARWAATARRRTSPCVGIGDMSGDVFGNGMLLSKHIRLLAAFDHRHIFLDPNPGCGAHRSRNASACSSCRARAGTTTTRR